jgi:hypothetical protein
MDGLKRTYTEGFGVFSAVAGMTSGAFGSDISPATARVKSGAELLLLPPAGPA